MGVSLMAFPNGRLVEALVDSEMEALEVHSYRLALSQEVGDAERSVYIFIVEVREKRYSMKIGRRELEEDHISTLLSLNIKDLATSIKQDVKFDFDRA